MRGNIFMRKSFYDWCLENKQENVLQLWDYDKNIVSPKNVMSTSKDKYYFNCPQNKHESSLIKIANLTYRIKTKTICRKCNSLAQYLIDLYGNDVLERYWDYDKNVCNPWDVSRSSHNPVYIKCQYKPYHGSYLISPKDIIRGRGCPYCRGLKTHPLDSFAAYCNDKLGDDYINKIWDYELNDVSPWNIAPQSNIYVYLKCTEDTTHPSYRIFLPNVFKTKYRCSQCALEHQDSTLQQFVVKHIAGKYQYNILHEYECSIKIKNPKTNRWLRYDNEVIISDDKHLFIEVHGMQHFIADCGYNNKRAKKLNITSEDVLKDQKYRDDLKQQYVLDNGFDYLAIPYWTENDGSYKTLIDQKIQEILSHTQQND